MKNKVTTFELLCHLYENQINEYDLKNRPINKIFNDIQIKLIISFYHKHAPNAHLTSGDEIIMYMGPNSNIMEIFRNEFGDLSDEEIGAWTSDIIPSLIDTIKSKVKFHNKGTIY